jgi:hypothetical protein
MSKFGAEGPVIRRAVFSTDKSFRGDYRGVSSSSSDVIPPLNLPSDLFSSLLDDTAFSGFIFILVQKMSCHEGDKIVLRDGNWYIKRPLA